MKIKSIFFIFNILIYTFICFGDNDIIQLPSNSNPNSQLLKPLEETNIEIYVDNVKTDPVWVPSWFSEGDLNIPHFDGVTQKVL